MSKPAKNLKSTSAKKTVATFQESRLEIPKGVSAEIHFQNGDDAYRGTINNISEHGLRVTLEKAPFTISSNRMIYNIQVLINKKSVYEGSCKVVDELQKNGFTTFGLYLTKSAIDMNFVSSVLSTKVSSEKVVNQPNTTPKIQSNFKILCSDFLFLLTELQNNLLREELKIENMKATDEVKKNVIKQTLDLNLNKYTDEIRSHFSDLQDLVSKFDEETHQNHKQYFRTLFQNIFVSSLVHGRPLQKSPNYSSDYGLMLMFYEEQHHEASLFEQFMHRFICNEPAALRNLNRMNFLSNILVEKYKKHGRGPNSFKVSSVACGSGKELRLMLEKLDEAGVEKNLDLILIDQEPEALDYSNKKIKALIRADEHIMCRLIQEDAVMGAIKNEPFTQHIQNSDVIVSAGLFDYLSDRVASELISCLFAKLRPGGCLLLGNMSNSGPDQFSTEYLMEWKPFQRSSSELQKLVPSELSKTNCKVEVIEDPLGINLFLVVTKK